MADEYVARRLDNALLLVKFLRQVTPDAHVDVTVTIHHVKLKPLIECRTLYRHTHMHS